VKNKKILFACPAGKAVCPQDNRTCSHCKPDVSLFRKVISVLILALLLLFAIASSSCSSQVPYWHVTRHDGMQKLSYKVEGWGYDSNCTTYPNTPVKRSTWAKQHYWKRSKK